MEACEYIHMWECVRERERIWMMQPLPHPSFITFSPPYVWLDLGLISLHKREIIYFNLTEEYSPSMSCWASVQVRQFCVNLDKPAADTFLCMMANCLCYSENQGELLLEILIHFSEFQQTLLPYHTLTGPTAFIKTWPALCSLLPRAPQRSPQERACRNAWLSLPLYEIHFEISNYIFQLFAMKWTHESNFCRGVCGKKDLRTNDKWYGWICLTLCCSNFTFAA